MTDTNQIVGRIIKVSKQGWGFISSKEIEFTRIFFHWTALRQNTVGFKELHIGMTVEFTPVKIPGKGYRAVHVRVLERNDREPVKQFPPADEIEYTNEEPDLPALPE